MFVEPVLYDNVLKGISHLAKASKKRVNANLCYTVKKHMPCLWAFIQGVPFVFFYAFHMRRMLLQNCETFIRCERDIYQMACRNNYEGEKEKQSGEQSPPLKDQKEHHWQKVWVPVYENWFKK